MARPPDMPEEELQKLIDMFFEACKQLERFPTESGMRLYIAAKTGKDPDKLLALPRYKDVLNMAKLRRIDWLENRMVTEPKCAVGCMNALKQEKNGGYVDRSLPEKAAGNRQLKILLDGVGKKAAR